MGVGIVMDDMWPMYRGQPSGGRWWWSPKPHTPTRRSNPDGLATVMAVFWVVLSMLCCDPGEIVVANEELDGTNMIGQLLGEG
jgi:hypothetical protein